MKDQFFIILPSDSSAMYFPENTAAHYTTMLPHEINLQGDWAVALTEIQFPYNFVHIANDDEAQVIISNDYGNVSGQFIRYVSRGLYENVDDLIRNLNSAANVKDFFKFEYDRKDGGYVKIRQLCGDCESQIHTIEFSKKLKDILGFEFTEYSIRDKHTIIGSSPPSLARGLPNKMFVYSDICEPYITGDTQTPLLRIVPLNINKYVYGTMRDISFSSANYIPLLHNSFRTIEIDIRDAYGNPIPFDYGPLNVTLHFKRIH